MHLAWRKSFGVWMYFLLSGQKVLRLFDQRRILSVCGSLNRTVRFQCLHPISVSPFHGTMSARHPHWPRWHNKHNLLSLDAEKGGWCMLRDVVQMKTACLRIMAANWMNKQSSGGWTESLLIPVGPPRPLIVVTVVVYGLPSNQMLLCSQKFYGWLTGSSCNEKMWGVGNWIARFLSTTAVGDLLWRETHLQCANWPVFDGSEDGPGSRQSVVCGLSFSADGLERSMEKFN